MLDFKAATKALAYLANTYVAEHQVSILSDFVTESEGQQDIIARAEKLLAVLPNDSIFDADGNLRSPQSEIYDLRVALQRIGK